MRTRIQYSRASLLAPLIVASFLGISGIAASARNDKPPASNNPKWNYEEIKNAPEKARLKQNPLENDPEAVRAGGKLFERNCSGCHGMKAEGGRRAPSLLREEVQQATPGALFWVLTNGVVWHGMPVWSKLPEPQRWQIVTFLKSFKPSLMPGGPGGG